MIEESDISAQAQAVERELDRLSLEQALRDFEVANARVHDLTERLMAATRELGETRRELDKVQAEYDSLRSTHDQMRSSAAFRLANRIWEIRHVLHI